MEEERKRVYFQYENLHEDTLFTKKDIENFKDKYMNEFCDRLDDLLTAMEIVFHECNATKDTHKDLDRYAKNSAIIRRKIITTWHKSLAGFYQRIKDRDATVIKEMNVDFFHKLKIAEKWNDAYFDQESKESFWLHVINLNFLSNGYDFFANIVPLN